VGDKDNDEDNNENNKTAEQPELTMLTSSSSSQSSLPPPPTDILSSAPPPPEMAAAVTQVMISQSSRWILIEELGYRRSEVDRMRPELAGPIIEKRLKRPATESNWTMPADWCRSDDELLSTEPRSGSGTMMKRLEDESKYPLKVPLLGIGLILFGKGFGDAAITLIKVNSGFPGASLFEMFLGVPVLAIDLVCVLAGAALASWTWNTMQDG